MINFLKRIIFLAVFLIFIAICSIVFLIAGNRDIGDKIISFFEKLTYKLDEKLGL